MKVPKCEPPKYMLKAMTDEERLDDKMDWEDTHTVMYKTKRNAYKYFGWYSDGSTWQFNMTAKLYEYDKKTEAYHLIETSYPIYFCRYVQDEYNQPYERTT